MLLFPCLILLDTQPITIDLPWVWLAQRTTVTIYSNYRAVVSLTVGLLMRAPVV